MRLLGVFAIGSDLALEVALSFILSKIVPPIATPPTNPTVAIKRSFTEIAINGIAKAISPSGS